MALEKTTPDVVLDFSLEGELLFLSISNNSDEEATQVKITFNKRIHAYRKGGTVNALHVFDKLLYLAPRKEIKIFIDQIDAFFKKNKLPLYRVKLAWKDISGKKNFSKVIYHNLDIYRDLPILYNSSSSVE